MSKRRGPRYRADKIWIIDAERYFVIPDDGRPIGDFYIAGRRISDEVVAHCNSFQWALRIADALNFEEMTKA